MGSPALLVLFPPSPLRLFPDLWLRRKTSPAGSGHAPGPAPGCWPGPERCWPSVPFRGCCCCTVRAARGPGGGGGTPPVSRCRPSGGLRRPLRDAFLGFFHAFWGFPHSFCAPRPARGGVTHLRAPVPPLLFPRASIKTDLGK